MIKSFIYNKKVAPYVFILPFMLTFLVFFISPMVNAVIMSFQDVLPGSRQFIGLKNFTKLLGDKIFIIAIWNSVKYTFWTIVLLVPIPLVLACIVNSKIMIGREFFKSAFFLPSLTSVVVAGIVYRMFFGEKATSLANEFIALFGMEPIKWLKVAPPGFIVLILFACWRWMGVNMMYFLSGLKSIPSELYESARIDGASTLQTFRSVTIPMLKPTTIYVVTISVIAGLSMFTESLIIFGNNNSPNNIGTTIVGYLYRQGIEKNAMGYASAVGIILFILAMAINLIQLKLSGSFDKEA